MRGRHPNLPLSGLPVRFQTVGLGDAIVVGRGCQKSPRRETTSRTLIGENKGHGCATHGIALIVGELDDRFQTILAGNIVNCAISLKYLKLQRGGRGGRKAEGQGESKALEQHIQLCAGRGICIGETGIPLVYVLLGIMESTAMPLRFVSALFLGGFLMVSPFALAADFPDPVLDAKPGATSPQIAVLAGGCFWCTEVVFEYVAGVSEVVSGYAGGTKESARYDAVSAGATNHAEVIQVKFDPAKVSYGQILKIFFAVAHDPTQLNRQGPDWGKQYRSEIFYADEEQKKVAEAYIAQVDQAKVFSGKIVTRVSALEKFYPAEGYHQDFVKRNPNHGYVVVHALPKVEKLKKNFPGKVKK